MLTKSAIEAAYPVAAALAARGVSLTPQANTAIAAMVEISLPAAVALTQSHDGAVTPTASFAEALSEGTSIPLPGSQESAHDQVKADLIRNVANGISATHKIARNEVATVIKRVVASATEALRAETVRQGLGMAVIPYFYKDIWASYVPREMAAPYEGRYLGEKLRVLPVPEIKDWASVTLTGVPSYDPEVEKFLASCDNDYLQQIWAELFQAGTDVGKICNRSFTDAGGVRGGIDAALLIHLWARNLRDNPPAGLNTDLANWRMYCTNLLADAGALIMRNLRQILADNEANRFVIGAPAGRGNANARVYVLGEAYNRFLENGGSPEVVLGAYLADDIASVSVDMPREKAEAFAARYSSANAIAARSGDYTRRENLLRAVRNAVAGEIAICENPLGDKGAMHELLKNAVAKLDPKIDDIWVIARHLVCRSIFPHTDAESFLSTMDCCAQENPELAVREAALLATIEHLVDWTLEQVVVATRG